MLIGTYVTIGLAAWAWVDTQQGLVGLLQPAALGAVMVVVLKAAVVLAAHHSYSAAVQALCCVGVLLWLREKLLGKWRLNDSVSVDCVYSSLIVVLLLPFQAETLNLGSSDAVLVLALLAQGTLVVVMSV